MDVDSEPSRESTAPDCLVETGRMLRYEREVRQLTLSAVAGRAGITQAQLSRVERGLRDSPLSTIDRILEVFELQLCPTFEPRWAQVDAAIARARDQSPDDRLREWADRGLDVSEITTVLTGIRVPFLVDGLSAAALQRAPVPVDVFEIAVAHDDEILELKVRLAEEATSALYAEIGTLRLPMVPLADIETADRRARRILQRMRNPPRE